MELNLENQGFKPIANPSDSIPGCVYLSKRQTLNSNRAICVIQLAKLPDDIQKYLMTVRTKVAFKVGFFPLFWGLGLQVILICPGISSINEPISSFAAKVDNQWAIIQSVFFVDPEEGNFIARRTWGQFLTGKYQDEIFRQLQNNYHNVST